MAESAAAALGLQLDAVDFSGSASWRWVLSDESGGTVATYDVRLDETCWQFEAFLDVHGYLAWQAAPDRQAKDVARIIRQVGEWIATEVFGPIADELVRQARWRHVTARVVVPDEARELLFRPLELAHVNGRPLAVQDVTLVMQASPEDARITLNGRKRLRVLGLFSLPEGGQTLNLRRERQALVELIHGIAATEMAADVRVLQYGVTRQLLKDVLTEAEGWDIVHISGHGSPGELLLETAEGKSDRVGAAQLADLLKLAREHVKLVTVSACWSAALTVLEQRRRLGLPVVEGAWEPQDAGGSPATLATELTDRLGCAVLAMRYPVDDEFAITLTKTLYNLLAAKNQPLPLAVSQALKQFSQTTSALLLATPVLFGGAAAGLRLGAPERDGPDNHDPVALKLAGFPPQPERFVGRTGVMARASACLARNSRVPGVLLHGMPGGGKTACALELAYGHEHTFDRLVWYKAPDQGMAINGALTEFALTLERYLDQFQMAHLVSDEKKLAGFLPKLTELMRQRRVLIVIDNAESLLSETGEWCDERWGQVVDALCSHAGLGRVVLTSRLVPAGLLPGAAPTRGLHVEAVDALSADEALLLTRELPDLRKLINGDVAGIERHVARRLARRALEAAQGHPKLLQLANSQAAYPDQLAALVEAGDQAWREQGGLPEGFFTSGTGESTAAPGDYWHVLAAWSQAVSVTLTAGGRDLFWLLCCLEEPDRVRPVLEGNWAGLWHRLDRDGQPPGLDLSLAAISARGLAAIREGTEHADESYALHPGIAAAGRTQAGEPFRHAVDAEAAIYWAGTYQRASGADGGIVHTGLLVRAGLGAVPYLVRLQRWDHAAMLLEGAFNQDPSRANAVAVLPAIEQIARHAPRRDGTVALVLEVIDPAAGEARARVALHAAIDRGDYHAAAAVAGQLAYRCRETGRLAEALALTEKVADYTRQAGLGAWTQLSAEGRRLQVLIEMGQADQVLAEVTRLRAHMDTLPATEGPNDTTAAWKVREVLLDTGRDAAARLGRWTDALDLSAAIAASERDRAAPRTVIARTQFNGYEPLLRLGRTQQALDLLQDCLATFRDAHDAPMIANILTALADTEEERGHGDAAVRLECDALRYAYLADDILGTAISYHNLGGYLARHTQRPAAAFASHLASALIGALAGTQDGDSVREAAIDLREFGEAAAPPKNVADLCDRLADFPGTDLPGLLATLSPDAGTTERTLSDLVAQAQEQAAPIKSMLHKVIGRRSWATGTKGRSE